MRLEIFVLASTLLIRIGVAKIRCRYQEFACANRWQCISSTKFCDGNGDCRDGSDEIYRNNIYVKPGLPCRQHNLVCMLPQSHKFKKKFICRRDEICQDYEFACEDGSGCLPRMFYCDGTPDCRDGSDEIYRKLPINPLETRTPCRFHKFICMLPESQESKRDILCTKGLECNDQEFECEDGSACLPSYSFCDGSDIPWTDCRDRSDERLRVLPMNPSEDGIPCRRHHDICLLPKSQASKRKALCIRDENCGKEFACEDGTRCLPAPYFCDGATDPEWRNCRDRSDERRWASSRTGIACRQYDRTCVLPTSQESKIRMKRICKKSKAKNIPKGEKWRRNRKSRSG